MPIDRFSRFGIWGGAAFFTINSLVTPFFGLYAEELGASTFAIGLLITLKAFLPIFIAMPAGQLIDTLGPAKMLKFGSYFLIASLVAVIFAQGVALLALSQALVGAAIIIMASAFHVLVSRGDRERRNEAIKRYSMWMSAGGMVGPLLGGAIASAFYIPAEGYYAAFVAATVASILFMFVITVVARGFPHPDIAQSEVPIREIFSPAGVVSSYRRGLDLTGHRPVQFGLTATFVIMYIQAIYMGFLPLFLNESGYSTLFIAIMVSLKGFAGMAARYLLGPMMARFASESILMAAGSVAAICVVLTPLAALHPSTMLFLGLILGGAVGLNLPLSIMIMVEAIGEAQRGKLMGLRLLVNRLAQIVSPALFGVLGQAFGLSLAFFSCGSLLVGTVAGLVVYHGRSWKEDSPVPPTAQKEAS